MFHVEQTQLHLKEEQDKVYIKTKDFLVSGEEFSLIHNSKHGYLETHPQPPEDKLSLYYESEDYISHVDNKHGLLAFLYRSVKKYTLQRKINLANNLSDKKGRLLDIGSGTGDFLLTAKNRGWKILGVEPNQKARARAKTKNIDCVASIADLRGQKFDVISLWHVLEHMPDLENTIEQILDMLDPGGHLIIAVPNFNSFDARYYEKFWAAYDVPRHLWHFSRRSMKSLFEPRLYQKKIAPMMFDSFYVSLLSEKYQSGRQFSLRAFWIGLRSNLSAWCTKEYSSLIYCYQKPISGN
ncbi:MAG: class I SAM-dependent methyltransferase [Bacteroidia bacterium]|nr:class I SAM-dependent methyltransferase [Bacteroidia bacterium]